MVRVGIMGAGAVGCYVGGHLLRQGGVEVTFVGRSATQRDVAEHGLTLQDMDAPPVRLKPERIDFQTDVAALRNTDVVLCCVKSAQTDKVGTALAEVLRLETVIVSLQNGVRNPVVLRARLPAHEVLAGIVSFNVVAHAKGRFHRATTGPLLVERSRASAWVPVKDALKAEVGLEERVEIASEQWTKLLVNLSNAVSALSGVPTQELILNPGYRRILAALVEEGVDVLRAAKIRPARYLGVPISMMPRVLRFPTPLVRFVTSRQARIDPDARSSMYQDLARGRMTEVDFLNGEIVALAVRVGAKAPLNERVVSLVHDAERAGHGSPKLSASALWAQLVSE